MSPGSTVRPDASITSVPAGQLPLGPAVVTASIRPFSICTTASRTGGAPLPSIKVPARMIFIAFPLGRRRASALHRAGRQTGDVVLHEERVDDGDRHRAEQRRRHELAPVEDVA